MELKDQQQLERLRRDIDKLSLAEKIDEQLSNSSLRYAVQQNNVAMIEKLLKNGANPNSANEDGSTPLHVLAANPSQYSTMTRFFEIIDEKHKNDDAQKRIKETTPLRVALKQEYEKIKSVLTERYNPTPKSRYGLIKRNGNGLVDMFFDEKHQLVRLDAQDKSGDTPLHLAFRSRNAAAIILLLSRGADPAFRNASGLAALPKIFRNSENPDFSILTRPTLNSRINSPFERAGDDRFQQTPLPRRKMSARTMYDRAKRERSRRINQQEPLDLTVGGSRSVQQNIDSNLNFTPDHQFQMMLYRYGAFLMHQNPTGNFSNNVHKS